MFVLRNILFKNYSIAAKATTAIDSITKAHLKVSPAAYWHANFLGISLEGIKGTGPKGHILKSDILQMKSKMTETIEAAGSFDFSFLVKVPSIPSEQIINKCLVSITKLSLSKLPITELNYKSLPEIGLLQFELKIKRKSSSLEIENIKNLLRIYLNDSSHLLL